MAMTSRALPRCPRAISTTNCWSSSICPFVCCRLRLERLLSHFGPQRSRLFALIAFELVRHPEQRTEDGGAIIAGQLYDASLDDEASEFNEMPRALAASH